tara:strand:- start:4617 stop:5042 length:426 start_codon:yes stop_codon:yes gene_type:complete
MLQLDIHPSRYLLAIILLTHIAVMLLLLHLPIQWWAIILIECCIVGSFIHSIRYYIVRRFDAAVTKVWCDSHNQWFLLTRSGEEIKVKLLGDSVSSNFLILLNVRIVKNNKRQSILIFNDAVKKSDFRRMRSWLTTHKGQL